MAILNDLIVRGATRCLNKLYADDLQVDSQTISGDLTVNGYTYMGFSTKYSDSKLSVHGVYSNGWYRSVGDNGWYSQAHGGGIYMTDSTYVKTFNNKAFYAYNGLYTGSTQQYYLNVNGKLNAADGVFSNNINVGNSLIGRNISATNLLRAAKYDLQTVTQMGTNGTLYVAPSIQFPTSNTTSVTAASTSITIIDTNITSDVMAGVVWRPSAKVKISGTINGVVTGTVDGTITSINTSSKTMVIGNLSGGNWSSVVAGTYTKDKIENLNIMMYETYQNSAYYPVGILLTSYGSVSEHTDGTAKTFIDIYGGSATKPVVRLGNMTGLPTINGTTPSGWGLYTDHGYFNGLIVSTSGKIGGWSIGENSIFNNTNSMTSTSVGTFIGQAGFRNYKNTDTFVNIKDGVIEAKGANISGSITATSFSAYDSNNKERATVNTDGLIVKDASGNTVATFGETAQIGLSEGNHVRLVDDAFSIMGDGGMPVFDISSNGTTETIFVSKDYDDEDAIAAVYLIPRARISYYNLISVRYWALIEGERQTGRVTFHAGTDETKTIDTDIFIQYTSSNDYIRVIYSGETQKCGILYIKYEADVEMPVFTLGTRGESDSVGGFSAVIGESLIASSENQTVLGRYNVEDTADKYALIVGNGIGRERPSEYRSNALTVDWDGNVEAGGQLINYTAGSSGGWTWRKYADGTLDLWGSFSGTSTPYSGTVNGWYPHRLALSFPANAKPNNGDYSVWQEWEIGTGFTMAGPVFNKSASGCMAYVLAGAQGSLSYTARFYIHGTWK